MKTVREIKVKIKFYKNIEQQLEGLTAQKYTTGRIKALEWVLE